MGTRTTLKIRSALCVVNRPSGKGRHVEDIERLQSAFHDCFDPIANRVFEVTEGHDEVLALTRDFVASFRGPWFLLSGGGGGTNKALVQGLLEEVNKGTICLEEVYISSLRLGSGNLVPKHFGLPREPVEGMGRIADDLFAGRSHPCCVYCCTLCYPNGKARQEYGLTMGGLGQFARVPGDIKRWKDRHRTLHQWACRIMPLERVNTWQYVAFSLIRAARCIIQPRQAKVVEIKYADQNERLRLLAGMLLNFDFPQLPIRGGCDIGEPRLMLCLIPHKGRGQTIRTLLNLNRCVLRYEITPETPIEILFADAESGSTTLALDEDTFTAPARIKFKVAGMVKFVTGQVVTRLPSPLTHNIYGGSSYVSLRQHHWH